MSLDLSTLQAYTNENADSLIAKALMDAKTQGLMQLQTGIKSADTINILETDADFQDGSSCGFNASGSTKISQRTIVVSRIKVNEAICPKDLEAYYVQKALKPGSRYENIPFEQAYAELKAATIAKQIEINIWQGDTGSSDGNIQRFDGLLKIIDAASGPIPATTTAAVTIANIRTILDEIYTLLPVEVLNKEDLAVFMGWDNFRLLIAKLTADNLFHYTTDDAAKSGEIMYPGTGMKIIAVNGLNGTDRIIALRESNMYFGTDLEHEEEKYEIFYAKEADEVRYVVEFKAGVQVAFPDQIVSYQNT